MSARRKLLLALAVAIGGALFLCVACVVGTTALSAVGILPPPDPTVAAVAASPTAAAGRPPAPTPTPPLFVHDPTTSPSRTEYWSFRARSGAYTNRADLVPPAGQRYLLLSLEVSPNRLASKGYQRGTVYEPNFRLFAGGQELLPDVAARERIGARGFGDKLGTTITSSQRRTLIFLVPADQEHFQLRYVHGGAKPIGFTVRSATTPDAPDAPLPPEGEG